MRKTKMGKSVLTVILSLIMVFEMIVPSAFFAAADDGYWYNGGAGTTVVDLDTSTKYTESLGDNASTEYAGRIWTDKSVYNNDVVFATYGGGSEGFKLNDGGNLGEDFLISYSALATAESISGQTQAPVDVVLIVDISGSMSNGSSDMDNGYSRIYNTVQATNNAIESLMNLNPYTRVAVVAFSSNATTLLSLGRYSKATTVEREWVQTGRYSWQGYWEEYEVELPYFSLSRNTGSSNYATLYVNAISAEDGTIEDSISVEGGTNIQMGLYEGMNILATEKSTTVNINGATVQRVPSVILLSDGSPTYSSDSKSWWAPSDNYNDGPGSTAYAGNGMKAILVGSYMKAAIDRNYKVSGTSFKTRLYTVGMGITNLPDDEKNLAYMTLNTGENWNSNSTNTMKTTIKDYWASYTERNNTGTLNINVGRQSGNTYFNKNYALTHPTTGYDVDPQNGYDYVDDYYDADNAAAVLKVFEEIVSNISIAAPQVPTEIKGSNPINSGYITYTDPIGEYMEVKDVKGIIYAGTKFTAKNVTVNGNTTTYTFSGEVHSPVYGDQNIANIIITVQKDASGKETLVIKIPASVIPLRVNEVVLNPDGTVKSHTNNGAYPTRVIYSVGLQSEVVKEDNSGEVYIDTSKLSAEYLAKNTNSDGTINFYSNLYMGTNEVNGSTAGNATVEFEPAHTNGFYHILEDMPIYKDAAFKEQVTATEGIKDDGIYYYKDEYYHGTSVEVIAIERTGTQLKKTTIKTGDDGYLYREAGSPRLNRILEFEGTKIRNATATAEDFYAPTFQYAQGSTDPFDGKFVIYQGNNGKLSVVSGGNLEITKEVNAAEGLTAPDKTFEFTIDLDGAEVNEGEYNYIITDAEGTSVSAGTISKNNPKIYLKDGQTATILSLPPETEYKVTETKVAGFTAEATGDSGTIYAGTTAAAVFTNTYNVESISYPTTGGLRGQKELAGREWGEKDSFTFFITPYNNAPLPTDYDADAGVTVDEPDTAGGQIATFDFGTIEFTAPGVYRYTIVEKEPENEEYLAGMTYSRALYRVVITIEDNGDGTLNVASSDIQRLYDDSANALFSYGQNNEIVMNSGEEGQDAVKFTNTYSAQSVTRVPVALKDYTDNSGANPLVSGMFEFKLNAVGYIVDNGSLVNDISKVPMPEGSVNGAITTTNEGHNVTFPSVIFTQSLIPDNAKSITFRYEMSEVIPANKVNGMTYDESVYTIDVVVSIDENSNILNVSAIYPNDERIVTFKNEYTPIPVTADINGNKTLVGRDMLLGESFEFNIAGANAATNNAVRNGVVVIGDSTVYAAGGRDGVAVPFAFEDIKFTKTGTYVFSISETAGNAGGLTYDDSVINVTVVIDDANKDGNLEVASMTYSNGKDAAEFENVYTTEFVGTPVSLTGTKKLTGKSLLAGEFYFNVAEYYNGTFVTEGLVTHTVDTDADANGVYQGTIAILNNVTYTNVGTYEYIINEQIPTPKVGGTTYDESVYRFTVVVEDVQKQGELTVTSTVLEKANGSNWATASAVEFTNIYVPEETTAELPLIKKVVAGDRSKVLEAGEFEFEIAIVSANPQDGIKLPDNTVIGNAADGSVEFGAITFYKAGTYTVSVKELVPVNGVAGITYDTKVITAVYNVVDDRNGNLTATLAQFVGGDTFANTYEATPAEVEIEIEKILQGRDWESTDAFEFEVVVLDLATQQAIADGIIEFPLDEGSENIATKTIDAEGETVVGNIKIYRPGTYEFIVREITGTIAGIHYDSTPRTVTIVATDNSDTATIEVTINGLATNELTLTFTNIYDDESTELGGHDNLVIEKVFTGRAGDVWLDSDKFVFDLAAADNTTQDAIDSGDIEMPASLVLEVTNANKTHAHFGNIVFHTAGEYRFKVTERNGGETIDGITYDNSEKVVIVNVKSDTSIGALVAEVDADSDDLKFNNTYAVEEVTVEGATYLTVIKSLQGREWLSDDEFTFTLRPFGTVAANAIASGDIVMNDPTTVKIDANSTEVERGRTAAFGDITFKTAGIYVFVINETEGNIDNISYDKHTRYVTITVTDNNEGNLVAEVSYEGSRVFVNTYTPDPIAVPLEGEKELEGNRTLAAGDFEFTVTADTANAPMPQNTTVENAADGTVSFGTIKFSEAGTYVYKINEVTGTIAGVTYDTESVTATVTVVYDEASGKLSATVSYEKGGKTGNTFTFVNKYKAAASDPISIKANKKVTATEGNSYTLKGDEFSFIIEAQNAPMPTRTTATNDADGNIDFGTVEFTQAGVYEYTVREVAGGLSHFSYDGAVYTVTVTVTDNTVAAKLMTSVKITDASDKEAEMVFVNNYDPKETTATIFGIKVLDSEHKQLEANEFEFTITSDDANAPMPEETTVKNAASGVFQFGAITYEKVGTYKYKITEKNLGKRGYTYDDKEYTVTVVVEDMGGALNATVSGVGTVTEPTIKFVNYYTPEDVDVVLGAKGELSKILEGREMDAKEFIFAVLDGEENEVATAENDEDGNFEFTLNFTKAGTYNYTIVEKNNEIAGVTYDEAVYSVEIVITDKGGYLEKEKVAYELENEEVEEVVFNNTYKAASVKVSISAVKVLKGRILLENEFEFVLKDADGEVVATATNIKDGKITFEEIEFTEAGTYIFTVSEKIGTLENVTYDRTEYVVEIEVIDEGVGQLEAKAPIIKKTGSDEEVEEIIFENLYTEPTPPPSSPVTGNRMNMNLWLALFFISGGGLFTTMLYSRKKRSNNK